MRPPIKVLTVDDVVVVMVVTALIAGAVGAILIQCAGVCWLWLLDRLTRR